MAPKRIRWEGKAGDISSEMRVYALVDFGCGLLRAHCVRVCLKGGCMSWNIAGTVWRKCSMVVCPGVPFAH